MEKRNTNSSSSTNGNTEQKCKSYFASCVFLSEVVDDKWTNTLRSTFPQILLFITREIFSSQISSNRKHRLIHRYQEDNQNKHIPQSRYGSIVDKKISDEVEICVISISRVVSLMEWWRTIYLRFSLYFKKNSVRFPLAGFKLYENG